LLTRHKNKIPEGGGRVGEETRMGKPGDKARDLSDLTDLIEQGEIDFCKDCKIYIHACDGGWGFRIQLAEATGFQVFSASGSCRATEGFNPDRPWTSKPKKYPFFRTDPDGTETPLGNTVTPPKLR